MRLAGLLLLLAAGALAVLWGVGTPLGAVIYETWPAFLATFQSGVQRRVAPELWDLVLLPLLEWPSWVLPVAFGLLCLLASRRRRGGHG